MAVSRVPPYAKITLKHAFGLNTKVQNNVVFIDEHKILYPVGRHIAVHNLSTQEMMFLPSDPSVRDIRAMAVSDAKTLLAVSEAVSESHKAQISVFNLATNKRMTVLKHADVDDFVSVSISHDSRYVLGQGRTPAAVLVVWLWERSKVLGSHTIGAKIECATFNPHDAGTMLTTGPKTVRVWHLAQGQLQMIHPVVPRNVHVQEGGVYTSQAWVQNERFCVGTDRGELYLFDQNVLTNVFKVSTTGILCLGSYAKGVVAALNRGTLAVFEESVGRDKLVCVRNVTTRSEAADHIISSITVSPSSEVVCCSLRTGQLAFLRLRGDSAGLEGVLHGDIDDAVGRPTEEQEESGPPTVTATWRLLSGGFHQGAVLDMDVCYSKPLLATCGADRSVRVTDYVRRTAATAAKFFREDPHCISIHPLGFHVVVGFSHQLRLLSVLTDTLREEHSFQLRFCREVRFSCGGQLFAAGAGNVVYVYSTHARTLLWQLHAHQRAVRALAFTSSDSALVSVSVDGTACLWSMETGLCLHSSAVSMHQYSDVLVLPGTQKKALLASSDFAIKEFVDGAISGEVETGPDLVMKIAWMEEAGLLLCGTRSGAIMALRYPPVSGGYLPPAEQRFLAHTGAIVRVNVSEEARLLFTVGEDGVVCVMHVQPITEDGPLPIVPLSLERYSDLVCTTSDYLEERDTQLADARRKIIDVQSASQLEIQRLKNQFKSDMMDVQQSLSTRAERDAAKFENMQRDLQDRIGVLQEEQKEREDAHMRELDGLVALYHKKYKLQEEELETARQRIEDAEAMAEEEMHGAEQRHGDALLRMKEEYERNMRTQMEAFDRLVEEMEMRELEHAEIVRQINDDHEDEVMAKTQSAAEKLAQEREAVNERKNETTYMRLRYKDVMKERDSLRDERTATAQEMRRLAMHANELEGVIADLTKALEERDAGIADKEKVIVHAKQRNVELEKYKYVLEYKNSQLQKDIAPRDETIGEMANQINMVDEELQRKSKEVTNLTLSIRDYEVKTKMMKKEIADMRLKLRDRDRYVKEFQQAVHDLYKTTEPAQWKRGLLELYKTHVVADPRFRVTSEDEQRVSEFGRQRMFMEETILKMKQETSRVRAARASETERLMSDNQTLIEELNMLRLERRSLQSELQDVRSEFKALQMAVEHEGRMQGLRKESSNLDGAESYTRVSDLLGRLTEGEQQIGAHKLHMDQLRKTADRASRTGRGAGRGRGGLVAPQRPTTAPLRPSTAKRQPKLRTQRPQTSFGLRPSQVKRVGRRPSSAAPARSDLQGSQGDVGAEEAPERKPYLPPPSANPPGTTKTI